MVAELADLVADAFVSLPWEDFSSSEMKDPESLEALFAGYEKRGIPVLVALHTYPGEDRCLTVRKGEAEWARVPASQAALARLRANLQIGGRE